MALLDRRRRDEDLPELDRAAARRLRDLVARALEGRGITARVEGDRAEVGDLGVIDLAPVAHEVADLDRGDWPVVVDEVVTRMVRSLVEGAGLVTDAALAEHAVVRLLADRERMGRTLDLARPVPGPDGHPVPGLVEVLAWYDDGEVDVLNDAALAGVDDLDAAFATGRRRLAEEVARTHLTLSPQGPVLRLEADSWLVSSSLLTPEVLPEQVRGLGPEVVVALASPSCLLVAPSDSRAEVPELLGADALSGPITWRW